MSNQDSFIKIRNLKKTFGDTVAINNISLDIKKGEFFCLLGPSGCGKTTLLRSIIGFVIPDSGEIFIDNKCVCSSEEKIFVPPEKRNIGLMFQNYALWPNMTIKENIIYGLKVKGVSREARNDKLIRTSKMLDIDNLLDRYPSQISGGQQQRVALARMLIVEPELVLMDEPLSNLDAKLRTKMRVELISLHQRLNPTIVYVTHDQDEALSLADRIALMNEGNILQIDKPEDIYNKPNNLFVNKFLGSPPPNIFEVVVESVNNKSMIKINEDFEELIIPENLKTNKALLSFRPEHCEIIKESETPNNNTNENLIGKFQIKAIQFLGSDYIISLTGKSQEIKENLVVIKLSAETFKDKKLSQNEFVNLNISNDSIVIFNENENKLYP